jgi:hypothetical protein
MQDKFRGEPNFRPHKFDVTFSIIRTILMQRLDVCQKDNLPFETVEAVISPILSLLLRAEQIQLDDPATFGRPPLYPRIYSEDYYAPSIGGKDDHGYASYSRRGEACVPIPRIKLSTEYRRILIRFMDQLGRARQELYMEIKSKREGDVVSGSQRESDVASNDRFGWPCKVTGKYLQDLPWEKDAPFLSEYIQKASTCLLVYGTVLRLYLFLIAYSRLSLLQSIATKAKTRMFPWTKYRRHCTSLIGMCCRV